jgi:hypothetical protein
MHLRSSLFAVVFFLSGLAFAADSIRVERIVETARGKLVEYSRQSGALNASGAFSEQQRIAEAFDPGNDDDLARQKIVGQFFAPGSAFDGAGGNFARGNAVSLPGEPGTKYLVIIRKPDEKKEAKSSVKDRIAAARKRAQEKADAINRQTVASTDDEKKELAGAGQAAKEFSRDAEKLSDAASAAALKDNLETAKATAGQLASAMTPSSSGAGSGDYVRIRTTYRYQGQMVRIEEATYRASDVEGYKRSNRQLNPSYDITFAEVGRTSSPPANPATPNIPRPATPAGSGLADRISKDWQASRTDSTFKDVPSETRPSNEPSGEASPSLTDRLKSDPDVQQGISDLKDWNERVAEKNKDKIVNGELFDGAAVTDSAVDAAKDMAKDTVKEAAAKAAQDARALQKFGRKYDELSPEERHELDTQEIAGKAVWSTFGDRAEGMKKWIKESTEKIYKNSKDWMTQFGGTGLQDKVDRMTRGNFDDPPKSK